MLDIREVLRRLQLDETDRRIARDLQLSRKTVRKYRAWAQQHGVLGGPLPDVASLQALVTTTLPMTSPPTTPSTVTAYRDRVVALRAAGVECRAIHHILRDEHAFTGSYQWVRLKPVARHQKPTASLSFTGCSARDAVDCINERYASGLGRPSGS